MNVRPPMVSIILPVYNREQTIGRAIDSILEQTYQDWELLIIYDIGVDTTLDIIKSYGILDGRINCILNENSKGCAGARNTGLRHTKGKYIAFLDSDDEWIDIHLEECIEALIATKYALCSALWIEEKYGQLNYIGQNYPFDYAFNKMQDDLNINRHDKLWIFDQRLFEYIIYNDLYCYQICTILVERDLIVRIGGFNEEFYRCEDIELIYRLLQHTSLVTVNNYHYIYHFGRDNMYAFIDFEKNGLSQMKQNKQLFKRWTTYLYYRILVLESMLCLVEFSEYIEDKEKAKQYLSYILYNRCMSYSYINRRCSIKNRILGFIKALKYMPQALKKETRLLLPGYRKRHLIVY